MRLQVIPNCQCQKCGYAWYSLIADLGQRPKTCPKCHRYDWVFPRVRKSKRRR